VYIFACPVFLIFPCVCVFILAFFCFSLDVTNLIPFLYVFVCCMISAMAR